MKNKPQQARPSPQPTGMIQTSHGIRIPMQIYQRIGQLSKEGNVDELTAWMSILVPAGQRAPTTFFTVFRDMIVQKKMHVLINPPRCPTREEVMMVVDGKLEKTGTAKRCTLHAQHYGQCRLGEAPE